MKSQALSDDRAWLERIVSNPLDHDSKLVYADWLEERGDDRSAFLRQYVKALRSMQPADLPQAGKKTPPAWLELIGFPFIESLIQNGFPELRDTVLRLARPALRMQPEPAKDAKLPVGASKIGGLPDLPAGFPWPIGGDCHAIYNDDTGGTERLAGFMAQLNLAETATTHAGRDLPNTGVLSFFCFQDIENDNPDSVGCKALWFPDAKQLVRAKPPEELTEGNTTMPAKRLVLEETLDLPETSGGPWSAEFNRTPEHDCDDALDWFRNNNFYNVLGYGRCTTGDDPTPSRDSRHLIVLKNAVDCRMHLQIDKQDLAARNFDALKLVWVDFD